MPIASSALQALVHIIKANPVVLRLSADSKTKLRIPNLCNTKEHESQNYAHN